MKYWNFSAFLIICIISIGCQSTPQGPDGSNIGPAIKTAAFAGTSYALIERPDWRPEFKQAAADLTVLEQAEKIDFTLILAIVQRLPVKELKSNEATLIITGATLLLAQYGGSADLGNVEQVRGVVTALREGIVLGLGAEPSSAPVILKK